MSPLAPQLDDAARRHVARNDVDGNSRRDEPAACAFRTGQPPRENQHASTALAPAAPAALHELSRRIHLLIESEGSASAIARRCGFSEGTVRNWRDGHHDISRERCVILARTLGISLLWLITGEGAMKDQATARTALSVHAPAAAVGTETDTGIHAGTVDPRRLAAALRLLQSYVGLAGGSLDPTQRAGAVAELYELLARAGEAGHADRMLAFHAALKEQLRSRRDALVA
jgi:hypothetical protein